jgi:glucan-binding YG repeat protein
MKDSKGWCYLGSDGKMVTNGWAKDSKGMCWMGNAGYMLVDTTVVVYESHYYGIRNGYMIVNDSLEYSGIIFHFGPDGICYSLQF